MERNLPSEAKQSKHIRIKPTVYRKARLYAFESEKSVAQWLEEAIEEKISRQTKKRAKTSLFGNTPFPGE